MITARSGHIAEKNAVAQPLIFIHMGSKKSIRLLTLTCLFVCIGGLVAHIYIGQYFIPSRTLPWPVLLACLAPPTYGTMRLSLPQFQLRIPTRWVRWIALPFFAFIFAGLFYVSGRGLIAAVSDAMAERGAHVELLLSEVRPDVSPRGSKRCDQFVVLSTHTGSARFCADRYLGAQRVTPGEIRAIVRTSPLGLHVDKLLSEPR